MADDLDLIAQLCTRAGMIMEDVTDVLLTMGRADGAERTTRLIALKDAAKRISQLIDGALALDR